MSLCLDLLIVLLAKFSANFCLLSFNGCSPSLSQEILGSSLFSEKAATARCSTLWRCRACWTVRLLDQATAPASRCTLPSAFQKLQIVCSSIPSFFILLSTQIFLDAFFVISATCSFHRRSSCIVIPRILRDDLTSNTFWPIVNSGGNSNYLFEYIHID